MASFPFWDLSTFWSVTSGLAVSALGFYSLRGGKARPRGALPFGLFALVWGVQISSINVAGVVTSVALSEHLYLISLVGLILLPFLLVEFAASQGELRGNTLSWYTLRFGTVFLALSAASVLVLQPSWLFAGVLPQDGLLFPQWGPAFLPLVSLPVFAALGVAVAALGKKLEASPTGRTLQIDACLFAGLGMYASYAAGFYLPLYVDSAISTGLSLEVFRDIGYIATFSFLAAFTIYFGYRFLRGQHRSRSASELDKWLAAAMIVPLLAGLLTKMLSMMGAGGLRLVGLFRLLGVGVITYGFARRRIFDLPQRVRQHGANATGSAGALAAGGTAFGVGSVLSGGLALPIFAGVAVAGATAMPALKWARQLFDTDEENPVDEAEQLYEQKIETYRAALEDAMARDTLEEDERFLEGLRERFGITDEEDRVLRYYARKSTVPRREGDPDTAYERLRILGEGGAGRTWLARDRSRDRLAVLKEPLEKWHSEPAVLEAARREAKLAAKVRHPNVVEVEEVLEDEGRPVLVMEYVTGGSLADKLRNEGTLEPREALRIGFDLAQGLAAIHDAGIVHRDLTPDNVLLTERGRALITDFGLARPQDGSGTQLLDDQAGTKGYQAPEVARGSDAPTVDVYGLAAILHTCLYGSPPVQGTIQVEAEVPRDLQAVVEKGLRTDPDDRFEDAEAFAEALEELVER